MNVYKSFYLHVDIEKGGGSSFLYTINTSLYISTSLSVSECVCLFVCLFPNSSETANPSKLTF